MTTRRQPDTRTIPLFDYPRPKLDWKPPGSLPDLSQHKRLFCDTETDGLNRQKSRIIGLSFDTEGGEKNNYIPIRHLGGGNLDERQVLRWIQSPQGWAGKDLWFLNAKDDLHYLRNSGIDPERMGCRLHDVAFPPALLNDNRRAGLDLESLSKEYLPEEYQGKGDLGRFVDKGRMAETHSSEVGPYAERDAKLVRLIQRFTDFKIREESLEEVLALEDSLIYCVAEMEDNGLRLDVPKLQVWDREIEEEYGQIIMDVWRETKLRVNPDSPPDMRNLLRHLNLTTSEVTATGEESFSAYALEQLGHPILLRCLRARRLASLRSKYVSKFLKEVGSGDVLRYSLHQLKGDEYGTVSGRFSGTNMSQQIMKGSRQAEKFKSEDHIIREAVIPDEGFDCCSADAAGIEFRLFVHYSEAENLIEYYRKDPYVDFHNIVTEGLRGPSFMKLDWKPRRARGKILSFGKIYGLSNVETAAEQLECSIEEAREVLDDYDTSPMGRHVGRLLRKASRLAETRGYVRTLLARRARFPHKQRLHSALNRILQGSAADINKLKLFRIWKERAHLGIHKLRLTLHDETVADTDQDPKYKQRWKEMLNEQEIQLAVPILWEVATGPNWRACE